ncbi:MAG: retron Ec67 family RNA-directed DNA polymerase/endonuclease [Bacteroidales bacterium]|nr:retron Ec67 family RNA-directed DNA polymerase/endonuclease [Bacteroidales bacterium]
MSRLEKLRKTKSLSDLAKLLGFQPRAVSYILYKIPEDRKYIEFEIPKKNGGKRIIKAPTEKLKQLQNRLADLLNECFDQISKESNNKSLSHGFRKKHSIVTNAKNHKNKRYVFNVDLQDFFPSINFGRVRGFFIKNHHFGLEPKVATVIAQIACHNNELPQGSPCSPIISNLIGHLLDVRMVNLAKKAKCTYSRYADDLTFSTNKKNFSPLITIKQDENNWMAGDRLVKEIKKVGFTLNTEKTSMQFKTARQMTTGLIVNEKINVRREYYKNARSMCYELFRTGEFYIDKKDIPLNNEEGHKEIGTINQLEGILSFIYQIKRPHDKAKLGNRRFHPTAITKLYRDFLFYKHFYFMEMPVILCEGKTDIIYLKCALRQLAKSYTEFVEMNDDGTSYKIKFLNSSRNFRDVFSISTGTSGLNHLMEIYEKNISKFKVKGKAYPVIIIIDNDDGSKEIKKRLNIKNDEKIKDFYHFVENLYVLIIPKDKDKAIEDLFDTGVRKTKIDGKVFNRGKKIDEKKEYGKIVFAEKVIKANQQKINFDRFKEVFDEVQKIIEDYKKRNV